ncbi:hypothetical protein [Streptomyces atratus]
MHFDITSPDPAAEQQRVATLGGRRLEQYDERDLLPSLSSRRFVPVRPPAAPFDPVRVVDEFPGVVEPGTPHEFDEVAVVMGEPDDLPFDGDSPSASTGQAVDDYRRAHAFRVRRAAAQGAPSTVSGQHTSQAVTPSARAERASFPADGPQLLSGSPAVAAVGLGGRRADAGVDDAPVRGGLAARLLARLFPVLRLLALLLASLLDCGDLLLHFGQQHAEVGL